MKSTVLWLMLNCIDKISGVVQFQKKLQSYDGEDAVAYTMKIEPHQISLIK